MDYTAKLLKVLYDIVELLKKIARQNDTIIEKLTEIDYNTLLH